LSLAFRVSLERTASFGMLPAEIIFQRWRDDRFQANAIFRATGKGDVGLEELTEMELTPEMKQHFKNQAAEFENSPLKDSSTLRYRVGVRIADEFAKSNHQMRASVEAMLTSIVLESWLFFEGLASDLWAVGVDNGGKTIANRIDLYTQWINPDEKIKA